MKTQKMIHPCGLAKPGILVDEETAPETPAPAPKADETPAPAEVSEPK